MKWLCVAILTLLIFSGFDCMPTKEADELSIRLPGHTHPLNYDVDLTVHVHNGTRGYSGKVKIKIACDVATDVITLHNKGLDISRVSVTAMNNDELENSIALDASRDFLFINLDRQLTVGAEYSLEIEFSGLISTSQRGFYRMEYKNVGSDEIIYLAATKFEPAYLRTAIVCYDEPAFKATYNLRITHHDSLQALSNTEGFRMPNSDRTITTMFEETPVMSPYLLAFALSDFDYSSMKNGRVEHRIYTRPDNEAVLRTQFALQNSDLFLKELERYVDFRYELSKLYQIALPDFASGGMENWGLITYKEQYLIVDEASHHREIIESIRVTAHELAHQFFGNAITCEWWSYIWIQEGLATLYEYHTSNEVLPAYRMKQLFNLQLQNGLRVDADENIRPMTNALDKNENLPRIFDRIAYDKSGSVLRMFQHAVGDDIFRDGLNRMLVEYNLKTVKPQQFYESIQSAMSAHNFNDFQFAEAFSSWELQPGSPIIHVSHQKNQKQFRITQERYLNADSNDIGSSSTWFIPINFAHASNPDFDDTTVNHYFTNGSNELIISMENIEGFDDNGWFVFNKQQLGFYRVNYDFENWHNIIKVLNSENYQQIHVVNRAQIVDDVMNLAIDGHVEFDVALGVLMYLRRETDYLPWASALNYLDRLDYLLLGTEVHQLFHRFVNNLISPLLGALGMQEQPGEDFLNKNLREIAINWSCRSGSFQCLRDAYVEVVKSMREEKSIPKPLEIALLCNAIKGTGKTEIFVHFWRKPYDSTDQAERLRIIDGLACADDKNIVKSFLDSSVAYTSDVNYRLHERVRIFNSILASSSIGIEEALDFLVANIMEVPSMYQQPLDIFLLSIARRVTIYEHRSKMFDFLSTKLEFLKPETTAEVLSRLSSNQRFIQGTKTAYIKDYLKNYLKDVEYVWRLPGESVPLSYDVHLKTDIHTGELAASGEVTIQLKVLESTEKLTLNSRDLTFTEMKLFDAENKEIKIWSVSSYDILVIFTEEDIAVGSEMTLYIKYNFNINDLPDMTGFYRTSYYNEAGEQRFLGSTHFVHTYARTVFPSYDEPNLKAVFKLHLTHHESYHAVSNTHGTRTPNGDGTVTTNFEQTPQMATYLIGFVLSDFEFSSNEESRQPSETLHRVSARLNTGKTTKHALEINVEVLKDLEVYLDFEFELGKLDSIAITGKDTPIVVWGLITYTEDLLLLEEDFEDSSHHLRLDAVLTISHELVHQFFGNAVLIDFWSHLWLIEGFTSFLEYQLTEDLHPDWRTRDFFNLDRLQFVFKEDEMKNAPSVTEKVESIEEIEGIFGPIAYYKAGSILRMFQNALGLDLFRDALRNYVKKNHHNVVSPSNFYAAVEDVLIENDFKEFEFTDAFRSWELQKGYPVIHVAFDASSRQFNVTQRRFFINANLQDDADSSWFIPLNFATSTDPNFENTKFTHFFEEDTTEKIIPIEDQPEWFVFNKQQLGYYRVNYDFQNWHSIILLLNSENYQQIHVLNRAQLVDDALSFANAGLIDYNTASGILMYLRRETDYVPWAAASTHFDKISELFGGKNNVFNKFMRFLSQNLYSAYPLIDNAVPQESLIDRFARETAIHWACQSGNEKCLHDTFSQVQHRISTEKSVPKGLEQEIYCNGLRGDNKKDEWLWLWKKMQESRDQQERLMSLRHLVCSDDEEVLMSLLESLYTFNSDAYYTADEMNEVFNGVAKGKTGVKVLVAFVRKQRNEIGNLFEILEIISSNVKDEEDLNLLSTTIVELNLSQETINSITQRAIRTLGRTFEFEVQSLLEAMGKIVSAWESEAESTTPENLTPTIPSSSSEETTETSTPTTLGASSLSAQIFLILLVSIVISLLM